MPTIEFEGKNTEEAIEKACGQLRKASDELKFEIITTGSSGIFGLGGKKARIRVFVEEKISKKDEPRAESRPEPRTEFRPEPRREPPIRTISDDRPEPRREPPIRTTSDDHPEPRREPPIRTTFDDRPEPRREPPIRTTSDDRSEPRRDHQRPPRDRDRDRSSRSRDGGPRDRNRRPGPSGEPRREEPAGPGEPRNREQGPGPMDARGAEPPRSGSRRPGRKSPRPAPPVEVDIDETPLELENLPTPPTVPGPGETVYEGPEDDAMIKGREALESILRLMSVEAGVRSGRIGERIILTVDGESGGLLIGKKGATLDALQFLINKILNRSQEEKHRVIVDTEDYRKRRHQSLVELARRMGEKAQRGKRPVTISQLTATERRVVHLALQEIPGLKTRSRGDGPLKNIVIIPGGKKGGPRSAEPNPEPEHGSDPEPEPDPVAPGEPPEAWDEAE